MQLNKLSYMKKTAKANMMKFIKASVMILIIAVLLSACAKNSVKDSFHINCSEDIYGSEEYLNTAILVAGNSMPREQVFTVAELEELASGDDNFIYSGYFSHMSSGGAFTYHLFQGFVCMSF